MKFRLVYILVCILCISLIPQQALGTDDAFIISLEPCWHCLDDNNGSCAQFGGKWVLIGNIIFKKRSIQDTLYLQQLKLRWNGPLIETMAASLYKKNFDPTKKEFLPIEDYLICDGIWNKSKQTLILTFDDKLTLGALEVFYLVLTVPDSLEHILRQGNFSLATDDLPAPFATAYKTQPLQLTLNTRR